MDHVVTTSLAENNTKPETKTLRQTSVSYKRLQAEIECWIFLDIQVGNE